MIRCVVVDDERRAREVLITLLQEHCSEVEVVGSAASVSEARAELVRTEPDLVFLDIAMPEHDGFQLLDGMKDRSFEVVFVTAHGHHAIRALRLAAVDYLLKPVDVDELQQAVCLAAKRLGETSHVLARVRAMLANLDGRDDPRLAIPDVHGVTVTRLSDVVRFEAAGNSTEVHLTDGRTLVATRSLKTYDDTVSGEFFRVHSSHLVNLRQVSRFTRQGGNRLVMTDGSEVPVARRRQAELLALLGQA